MKRLMFTLALLAPLAAGAEFFSGNELYARLQASDQAERASALGYLAGVFDTGVGVVHCAPPSVSLGQVAQLVAAQLAALPAHRHHPADVFVLLALKEAWPCPIERRAPPKRGT